MLAADANLEVGARVASLGRGGLHERACTVSLIEGGEGIVLEDAVLEVGRQEVVDVVARRPAVGVRSSFRSRRTTVFSAI